MVASNFQVESVKSCAQSGRLSANVRQRFTIAKLSHKKVACEHLRRRLPAVELLSFRFSVQRRSRWALLLSICRARGDACVKLLEFNRFLTLCYVVKHN